MVWFGLIWWSNIQDGKTPEVVKQLRSACATKKCERYYEVWFGLVWFGIVLYGMVRFGIVLYGMVCKKYVIY